MCSRRGRGGSSWKFRRSGHGGGRTDCVVVVAVAATHEKFVVVLTVMVVQTCGHV